MTNSYIDKFIPKFNRLSAKIFFRNVLLVVFFGLIGFFIFLSLITNVVYEQTGKIFASDLQIARTFFVKYQEGLEFLANQAATSEDLKLIIELEEFAELKNDQIKFQAVHPLMSIFFLDNNENPFGGGAAEIDLNTLKGHFGHFEISDFHFIYTKKDIMDTAGTTPIGKVLIIHNITNDKKFSENLKKLVDKNFVLFIEGSPINTSFTSDDPLQKYLSDILKKKDELFASFDSKYICQANKMGPTARIKGLDISLFKDMDELKRYLFNTLLIGLALVFGFTIFFSIVMYFSIKTLVLSPLDVILSATKNIMDGDLSVRVRLQTDDEISDLGSSFDYMTKYLQQTLEENKKELRERRKTEKKIRKILNGVVGVTEVLLGSSKVAGQTSKVLKGQAEKQTDSLVDINAILDQIEGHAKGNASVANDAHNLVVNINTLVNEGSIQMKKNIDSIHLVQSAIEEASKIVKDIDELAFKTNIISVNSAVEAARAGKYGKGFSVVAREVRNLALKSSVYADQAGESFAKSQERIEQGVTATNAMHEILTLIVEDVKLITGLLEEISSTSSSQANGIEDVNIRTSDLADCNDITFSSVKKTSLITTNLNQQIGHLKKLVLGGSNSKIIS